MSNTGVFSVVACLTLVLASMGVQGAFICLNNLTLFDDSEFLTAPEIYLVCDDGTSLPLEHVDEENKPYIFSPPVCLESDFGVGSTVRCQLREDDMFFDDMLGAFTIDDATFDARNMATVRVEGSFVMGLKLCENEGCGEAAVKDPAASEPAVSLLELEALE